MREFTIPIPINTVMPFPVLMGKLTQEQPPVLVTFTDHTGQVVGEFKYDHKKKEWSFQGDCDASATQFMNFLMDLFAKNQR